MTLEKEMPPIFGMIQRGGESVIRMLEDVQQVTIGPLIKQSIAPGTVVDTDEYESYARHPGWGSTHRTVCRATGELARDADGGGSCEVQVKPSPSSLNLNKTTKVSPSWKRESGGDWLLVGNTLSIGLPRQPMARRSTSAGLAPMGVLWDR